MEATNLGCCNKFSWKPIFSKNITNRRACRSNMVVRMSYDGEDHYLGRSVDESMIVLRLRIKKMKMLERNDKEAPSNWMEWEKQYYAHNYDEDVCEAIGLLQSYLMSLRPSVALGMLALVAMSVLISSGVGLFHALVIVRGILSCFGSS